MLGELSLDGGIQTTQGVLQMALAAHRHEMGLLLPPGSAREAAIVPGLSIGGGVVSLADAADVLSGRVTAETPPPVTFAPEAASRDGHLADVKGQVVARRALEIAAAGGAQPPLCRAAVGGKDNDDRRLPGILPPLTFGEAVETTTIHSVVGLVPQRLGMLESRPFRAPHHTVSDVAPIGGGCEPRPGELSLALNGVLFLHEIPKFDRRALEVLGNPLKRGRCVLLERLASRPFPPASCWLRP